MAKITSLLFIPPGGDLEKAVHFYGEAFDLKEVFRNEQIVVMGIPGTDSAVGVLRDDNSAGSGPQNVGFHIDHAINLDDAVRDVERAGGELSSAGACALRAVRSNR